jgi:hypothetical protein
MIHLDNSLNSLINNLNDQWSASLVTIINATLSDQENNSLLELGIVSILEPILSNAFDDLNRSLIEGEYANDIDIALQKLKDIESHITTRANFTIPGYPDFTVFSQGVFTEKFLLVLRAAVRYYKKLLDAVHNRLNFEPQVTTLFHLYNDPIADNFDSQQDLKLFDLNIQVAIIDHTLSFDNLTLQKLVSIGHILEDIASVGSVSDILKKKCSFLVSKLSHRLDSEKTSQYSIEFDYRPITSVNVPELEYYDEIIKGHYDDVKTDKFNLRYKLALETFNNAPDTLDFDGYHALIKYYKDIKPNLKKIEEVRLSFINFYDNTSPLSLFDLKARDIVFCYIENNLLSLELQKGLFNIDNWESKFLEYTLKADSFKNSNFFPYFKIIDQFLLPAIELQFKKDYINFDIVNRLISAYEVNLIKMSDNLKICQQTNYMSFQLDIDGCQTLITDTNGISWNCFISSSFVLPHNYSEWWQVTDNFRADLLKFKAMRDLRSSLRLDIEEIYQVKNRLAESDKRHIEILSIFAAIVMFVSNEVQMFSHMKSVAEAVVFTLFFAYALGLFVLLIWFVTRPMAVNLWKLPTTHYILLIFFSVGFFAAGGYLYIDAKDVGYIYKNKGIELKSQIRLYKDSITLDSLKQSHGDYLINPKKNRSTN